MINIFGYLAIHSERRFDVCRRWVSCCEGQATTVAGEERGRGSRYPVKLQSISLTAVH